VTGPTQWDLLEKTELPHRARRVERRQPDRCRGRRRRRPRTEHQRGRGHRRPRRPARARPTPAVDRSLPARRASHGIARRARRGARGERQCRHRPVCTGHARLDRRRRRVRYRGTGPGPDDGRGDRPGHRHAGHRVLHRAGGRERTDRGHQQALESCPGWPRPSTR